ncbi:ribonuclease H-like domain-containing protein [Tanacetum coccineum]
MVTRFRVGSDRPPECLNLHVSTISPLPKSYTDAFNDPNWQNVMHDEYNALIKNNTWTLVPRLTDANIVRCMWLFRHKHLADDTLSHYKACLVANGSTQVSSIDVDETFSLVVKPAIIQTVLSFATSRHWRVHQLDVKNAFLHEVLLQQIIASLHHEFSMTDLGSLNHFLGIYVVRDSLGMFLSQRQYATEILKRAHMVNFNLSRTPVDTESKMGANGDPVYDLTLYCSLAGSLQYLTFTRPDISYAVQLLGKRCLPDRPISNLEDAFSSNFPNYVPPASPDYIPTSPGKTYSSASNTFGIVPLTSPTLSLFPDDPYMKALQAFYTEKSPIPSPIIIPPKTQEFFLLEGLLSPMQLSPSTPSQPQVLEIGETSRKSAIKRHEEQIQGIQGYLEEIPPERFEQIENRHRRLW